MHYVYLLQSGNHHYVGYSTDLKRRLAEHNNGQNTSTIAHIPWSLVFYEAYLNEDDALRRERYLKTTQGRQALRRMLRSHLASEDAYLE